MLFAEVLIQHRYAMIQGILTYEVPKNIREGQLIKVPFRKQEVSGLVLKITNKKPTYRTRPIISTIEANPVLSPWQIKLLYWISEYYFADLYRTVSLFLPKKIFSGKWPKINSEHIIENKSTQSVLKFPLKTRSIWESEKTIVLYHHNLEDTRFRHYRNEAIEKYKKNQQTLILTAETLLTPTFVRYFRDAFQDELGVWDSNLKEKEKAEMWLAVKKGQIHVIIGSRSALFLPYPNLGQIIIDQEQERISYKQDQTPKYQAGMVAEQIVKLTGSRLIFSSHAPRVETFAVAMEGKAGLIEEKKHKKNIHIIDMREEWKKGNFSMLSDTLIKEIGKTLAEGKQVLLFLNKKGSASVIICRECGNRLYCQNCQGPQTFYQTKNILICHRCGQKEAMRLRCPHCKSLKLKPLGGGIERLENEIKKYFIGKKILTLSLESVKKRKNFLKIHKDIGKYEIIIGTNVLLKMETYIKVGLVGIVLADLCFQKPDFLTNEKAFQTLTNIINLKTDHAQTMMQSYQPENPILQWVKEENYRNFFQEEIKIRKTFEYPPFAGIIKLSYSNKTENKCFNESHQLLQQLEKSDQDHHKLLEFPAAGKRKGFYQHHLIIKGKNPHKLLRSCWPLNKGWRIDVDPISL